MPRMVREPVVGDWRLEVRGEGVSEQVSRLPVVHVPVVVADELDTLRIGPVFGFVLRGYLPNDIGTKERILWFKEGCNMLSHDRDEKFVADCFRCCTSRGCTRCMCSLDRYSSGEGVCRGAIVVAGDGYDAISIRVIDRSSLCCSGGVGDGNGS